MAPRLRRALASAPQSRLAVGAAHRATRRVLRVLGFHGVTNPARFAGLLSTVCKYYSPVSAETVVAAIRGEERLPDYPVWFTFDDGLPSTFDAGQTLNEHGISATAYVCPATVSRPGRLWFQTYEAALLAGLLDPRQGPQYNLRQLKSAPDGERRRLIAELEDRLGPTEDSFPLSVSVDRLRAWAAQGHSIGNHTWDHPCLDTCTEERQVRQVIDAHEALHSWGFAPVHFAYPNGNHTERTEATLRDLGYATGVLFDHHLTRDKSQPLRLSRLRIDSDATDRRALSILSGAHSAAFAATNHIRRAGHPRKMSSN